MVGSCVVYVSLSKKCQIVFQSVPFYTPALYKNSSPSIFCNTQDGQAINFSHSDRYVVLPHCGFNLQFPMANDVEHL